MFQKKSQTSVEYLLVIGFVTILTIPLILIYHSQIQNTDLQVNSQQILQVARQVSGTAEEVFFLGEPSQTEIKVNIPSNIDSVTISGTDINFKLKTTEGLSDINHISSVNLTGTLPTSPGTYTIKIKAQDDKVSLSYS